MSLHMGVMWRAICDCDILNVYVILRAIFDCYLWLQSLRRAIFDCNLWTIFDCDIRLRSLRRAIFGCDLFFKRGLFGRCLFWTFFCVWTLSFLDFLLDDKGFWIFSLHAARLDSVSFGRCLFLWERLFQTLSLSDFLLRLDAVSFGLSFWQCGVLMWLLTFGRGSFLHRLFRTLFLLDADALLRILLLFLGRGCFYFPEHGCSSSDASALFWTHMLSLGADFYGGMLTTFTPVPWYTYLAKYNSNRCW